jgi:hypothetical protein
MGMDVFGMLPVNETGEYFRRNVWWWHPLAECVCDLCPQETATCELWHSNDGDGLDAQAAECLGQRLEALLSDGTVAAYVAERDEWIATAPLFTCTFCDGSGVQERPERECPCHGNEGHCLMCGGIGTLGYEKRQCVNCKGQGKRKPLDADYFLTVDDVREFVVFVLASGGFEIW